MDPDVEIGGGTQIGGGGTPRPRPSTFVRLLEMAGLVLVAYGLGTNRFVLAAFGGGIIIVSYALYRRTHGPAVDRRPGKGPDGMDADGGGE